MGKDYESILLNKGYKQFAPSAFDGVSVKNCYQKAFVNKDNEREYFITFKKWDFSQFADENHPDLTDYRFEADTQLTYLPNGQVINLEFLCGWEPSEIEQFMKDLF